MGGGSSRGSGCTELPQGVRVAALRVRRIMCTYEQTCQLNDKDNEGGSTVHAVLKSRGKEMTQLRTGDVARLPIKSALGHMVPNDQPPKKYCWPNFVRRGVIFLKS